MSGRPVILRILHRPAWAAAATIALGGCADLHRAVTLPPVNPESPVAAEVRAGAPLQYEKPRLNDVPPVPRDIPPPGDVKAGVVAMVRCRGAVARFATDHPPLSAGPEQFASSARAVAEVNPADIPPPNSSAQSEAEAAQLRAYAAAPSAFASGPAPTANEGKPADLQTPAAPPARPTRHAAAAAHPAPAAASPAGPTAPVADAPVTDATAAPPPIPAAAPDPYYTHCS